VSMLTGGMRAFNDAGGGNLGFDYSVQ
jgi:hypothetical protein